MQGILRQTSWLLVAQVVTRIIGFFYTIFLARSLGVLDFGLYSLALAYFSIISSLADFGFNRFLIREVAKERSRTWELVCNILMLRLTLISIFFAVFSVVLYFFDPDKMRVSIILVAALAVFPQAVAVTFDGIFVALKKLQFSAVGAFVASISTAILGLILISKGFAVFGAVNAVIFGQFIFAVVLIFLLFLTFGIKLSKVKMSILKEALWGSLPYGLLAILGLLYFRIDTVLLSYIKGNFETGIYAAGYKFLESLVFIPNALSFALFPRFVDLHKNNPSEIRKLLAKSTKLMFLLGVFITAVFIFFVPLIIRTFLPNYLPAIAVIQILSLAIPFMFIHVPASSVLLSSDKYLKQVILFSLIPLSFNIFANLFFIPKYGFIAASWITVFSDILSTGLLFLFINRSISSND